MKKGFTLIELLIASAIFVTVMVIVTGIFSMAASYNGKLREMRKVSLVGRSVMEQLSTDVRLANGSLKEGIKSSPNGAKSVGEISLFSCANDTKDKVCWSLSDNQSRKKDNVTGSSGTSTLDNWAKSNGLNNSLLILQQKQQKIIFYRNSKQVWDSTLPLKILKRYEYTLSNWPTQLDLNKMQEDAVLTFDNSVSASGSAEKDYDVFLNFQGYGPPKGKDRDSQPYVQAALSVATCDYEKARPNIRARFDLTTTIETRDYN